MRHSKPLFGYRGMGRGRLDLSEASREAVMPLVEGVRTFHDGSSR